MIYASVCSGIEAATVAWHSLGWKPAWFSEIEPFPCRLLARYYPQVPNLGDMLKIRDNATFQQSIIDLLVGGTPCQSFSIAGLRGGLTDSRGNLALEFCRILTVKRPRWFIWENVPGVHSSFSHEEGSGRVDRKGRTDGREFTETADFASILAAFSECGYSVSWRVLDAQFFGVPQRRRRVFVVGHIGNDWRPSAAVLFESQSLRGNPAKGGKKGKEVAGTIGRRTSGRSIGAEEAGGNQLVATLTTRPYADGKDDESRLVYMTMSTGQANAEINEDLAPTLNCNHENPILIPVQGPIPINMQIALRKDKPGDRTGMGTGEEGDPAFTLQKSHHHAVCYPYNQITSNENRSNPQPGDPCNTLTKREKAPMMIQGPIVRRLTPLECERLQGFPDNYTAIPGAADSPRYESIGNSMATDVMEWLGRRINHVDKEIHL